MFDCGNVTPTILLPKKTIEAVTTSGECKGEKNFMTVDVGGEWELNVIISCNVVKKNNS